MDRRQIAPDYEQLQRGLEITEEALDDCLMQQAELYLQAANAHEESVSERDGLRQKIKIEEAKVGRDIKRDADRVEERITEDGIKREIALQPSIRELHEKLLDTQYRVGKWSAMKDSYEQRSKMISKLVDRQIAQLYNLGMERGSGSRQQSLINARVASRKEAQDEERRRYMPRSQTERD